MQTRERAHCSPSVIPSIEKSKKNNSLFRVLIVDGTAVLQSMENTPSMKELSYLEEVFIKHVKSMMVSYDEGRVISDHY